MHMDSKQRGQEHVILCFHCVSFSHGVVNEPVSLVTIDKLRRHVRKCFVWKERKKDRKKGRKKEQDC